MAEAQTEEEPKKKGSPLILISIVAALLLGGGAGAAVFMGLVPLGGEKSEKSDDHGGKDKKDGHSGKAGKGSKGKSAPAYDIQTVGDVAFVNLEPLIISLGPEANARHLRMTLSIETKSTGVGAVELMLPRVRDVLNTYLRAVEVSDLEDPAAMTRLRAQMVRRVRMVTPPDTVRDVLILDFILD
ncbi:MAG: flagellar basal body-associated FliL family protein [Pseudomonadota bacterium]